jgi:hypothetical protein
VLWAVPLTVCSGRCSAASQEDADDALERAKIAAVVAQSVSENPHWRELRSDALASPARAMQGAADRPVVSAGQQTPPELPASAIVLFPDSQPELEPEPQPEPEPELPEPEPQPQLEIAADADAGASIDVSRSSGGLQTTRSEHDNQTAAAISPPPPPPPLPQQQLKALNPPPWWKAWWRWLG